MSDERTIPTAAAADRPTFTLLTDGTELTKEYQVKALLINRTVNKITSATLLVLDGDPAKEDFLVSNSEDLIPGKEIEIKAGYHSTEETIFKGIIISQSIKVYEHKPAVLRIDCKDKAVKLSIGRKNKYYYESTDSEVWEEIIGSANLSPDLTDTTQVHQEMVQYYSTNWDFLVSRAELNGMCVYTHDGALKIAPPDLGQDPVLSLRYGGNLLEFEAEMDARNQFSAINAYSWDAANQELIEVEGVAPSGTLPGNMTPDDLAAVIGLEQNELHHAGQVKDAELQEWANALMLKTRLAKIQARARIQGFGTVLPGQMVEISGVGDRFSGNIFVSAVRHELNDKNWETHLSLGLSPKWFTECHDDISAQDASGVLPAIRGLQIGLVTSLEGDPEGEGRIQVRIPAIDAAEEGVWARVSTLDAGEERGTFFMPEIGDEVVLGFLNNEPRNPIVLGALNSSAKPAAFTPADDNHEKGLVTRSGIKLVFDDDKSEFSITTPGGNTLLISDDAEGFNLEDQNSNKLVMNGDGISLESAGDIQIKASGDVKIEGMNISSAANAQFKAEGTGGIEVSSSATAVLKGAIVQIN